MKKVLFFLLIPCIAFSQKATTAKAGKWSASSTWTGKKIPAKGDSVFINHNVTADVSATTATITINPDAVLTFSTRAITFDITGNFIVRGGLVINTAASVNQVIQFSGIDESKIAGGGMNIENAAFGLWVRPPGYVILKGAPKTAWLNLKDSLKAGVNRLTLARPPTGWRPGDTLAICPTAKGDYSFEKVVVKSVSGSTVTITAPLLSDHPAVKNPFTGKYLTAEVLNLTRSLKIQGKSGARSHINIAMISRPDTLANIEISYMGVPDRVGRYPLHFHMNGEGSDGSFVEGVVTKYSGNHAFVNHASDDITNKNCIAFDTFDAPYWWDNPPTDFDSSNNSNGITYDSCIAALIRCDPPYRGYRLPGFEMQAGRNNTCRNSITVGNLSVNGNGFNWGEQANRMDNLWVTSGLIAHNNAGDGELNWQNDSHKHHISDFIYYNNGETGIEHGAYHNGYEFENGFIFGSKVSIFQHANAVPNAAKDSFGYTSHCINVKCDGPLIITRHLISPTVPFLFKDCIFSEIQINELPDSKPGMFDFVNCGDISKFKIINFAPGSIYRIQQSGKAWLITNEGTKQIDL